MINDYVCMKRDSSLLPPVPAASPWIPSPQNPHRGYSFRSQGMRRTWPQQSPNVSTLEAMAKPIYSFRIVVYIYIYYYNINHIYTIIHTHIFSEYVQITKSRLHTSSCIKAACELHHRIYPTPQDSDGWLPSTSFALILEIKRLLQEGW